MAMENLKKKFTYHPPKTDQPLRYEAIRAKALELAELIDLHVPDSAEKQVSILRLEESVMHANAGIARNE